MKIEHIALASNSEKESDEFFIDLLGLEKIKKFTVSNEKMGQFFHVNETHNFIRYEKNNISIEVILTNKIEKIMDKFTHSCIVVDDGIKLLEKAAAMGYETIKVPRIKDENYYLFLRDKFGNLFEIKSQ